MAIKGGGLGLKIVGLKKKPKMEKNEIEQFSIHIVNEYVAGIEQQIIVVEKHPLCNLFTLALVASDTDHLQVYNFKVIWRDVWYVITEFISH